MWVMKTQISGIQISAESGWQVCGRSFYFCVYVWFENIKFLKVIWIGLYSITLFKSYWTLQFFPFFFPQVILHVHSRPWSHLYFNLYLCICDQTFKFQIVNTQLLRAPRTLGQSQEYRREPRVMWAEVKVEVIYSRSFVLNSTPSPDTSFKSIKRERTLSSKA